MLTIKNKENKRQVKYWKYNNLKTKKNNQKTFWENVYSGEIKYTSDLYKSLSISEELLSLSFR